MKGKCLSLSLVLLLLSSLPFFLSFSTPRLFLVFLLRFAARGFSPPFSFCSLRARCSLARRKNANARIIVGLIRFASGLASGGALATPRREPGEPDYRKRKRKARRELPGERRSTRDSIYTVRKRTAHVRVNYPRHREARLCTAIRWPIARGQLFFFFSQPLVPRSPPPFSTSFLLSLSLSLSFFSFRSDRLLLFFSISRGA